jgi:hypothetical protein
MTDFRALCEELHAAFNTYAVDMAHHDLLERARAALAQPELQGPPKNCWLDDEPDLCPSPCVFDDPSEVISNCVYAQLVKCKTDCSYYRNVLAQPEPQGPSLKEQALRILVENGTTLDGRIELEPEDIPIIRSALEALPND